ncbi:protein of unknown function [Burkholderia multivorans]
MGSTPGGDRQPLHRLERERTDLARPAHRYANTHFRCSTRGNRRPRRREPMTARRPHIPTADEVLKIMRPGQFYPTYNLALRFGIKARDLSPSFSPWSTPASWCAPPPRMAACGTSVSPMARRAPARPRRSTSASLLRRARTSS